MKNAPSIIDGGAFFYVGGIYPLATDRSATGLFDQLDVFRRIALILNQGNEVIAMLVLAVHVITGLDEERQETLEIVDPQTTVRLDQLVQGRRSRVDRFELEEQLDLLIADLVTNHLFLIFTHCRLQLADISRGGQFTPARAPGSTRTNSPGVQIGPDVAVGIAEKLAIHRVVAQQIHDHPVLSLRVIKRQRLALVVVERFFQAFAFAIEIDQHLTDGRPLVQGFALEADQQRRSDGDRLLAGLTLTADHHRILGDLQQLLLLWLRITQGQVIRRQELSVHWRGGGGQGQAEGQQQGGAAADQQVHEKLQVINRTVRASRPDTRQHRVRLHVAPSTPTHLRPPGDRDPPCTRTSGYRLRAPPARGTRP